MSFRCELEILEGESLPTSYRGGRPDAFVKIQFKQHDVTHHTKIIAASQQPVWCERFVVDGVNEMERVQLTMFDRDDSADSFIGTTEVILGGPTRMVGSKWVVLSSSPMQTSIRLLWKVSQLSSAVMNDRAAQQNETRNKNMKTDVVEKIAMSAVTETVCSVTDTNGNGKDDGSSGGVVTDSMVTTVSNPTNLMRSQVEAIEKLSATLELFMKQTERKFSAIEERLSDVEGLFRSRRNHLEESMSGGGLSSSSSGGRGNRFIYGSNEITSTSTAMAMLGGGGSPSKNRNIITSSTSSSKDDKNRTALENIFVNPTQSSADDEKLRVAYSLPHVTLPKSSNPSTAQTLMTTTGGDATDRNMAIKAMKLDHESRSMTRTV